LSVETSGRKIYQILYDREDSYLATSLGLFKNYRRVFAKGEVRAIALSSNQIYIASDTGIYQADKNILDWQLVKGSPLNVYALELESELKFALSEFGVYYYDAKELRWLERNSSLKKDFNDSYDLRKVLSIKDKTLITTSSGVYLTKDKGEHWQRLSMGLKTNSDGFYSLRDICQFGEDIFLATSQGLYYIEEASLDSGQIYWKLLELEQAKTNENSSVDIYSLAQHQGVLYAGTSQGEIYNISDLQAQPSSRIDNFQFMRKLLGVEPSVQEVQAIALDFAGLPAGNDFRRYRRQARLRNLLPNFESFGTHNAEDLITINTNGGDDFNSGTGSLVSSYDKDSQNRNNSGLTTGIRASWQLGNLVYDPEINDINNSARVVSNIRENLLTELTQIYFARRELQYKILSELPAVIPDIELSLADMLKDKLKLAEYTAQIDARTGAWFTRELAKRYEGGIYEEYFGT
jgi:hypothetical protein